MSYLSKHGRNIIDASPIGNCKIKNSEELGYAIMSLINSYLKDDTTGKQQEKFKEIVGTVDGVKQEFYRVFIDPSEKQKKFDNGDVY